MLTTSRSGWGASWNFLSRLRALIVSLQRNYSCMFPIPWKALVEMKGVLALSGVISIAEIDWGTLVVQSSDNELGRRFSDLACRELRNGVIIRELPGQLRALGFNHVIILPEVEVAQDLDALFTWFVEPSLAHFKRIGAFSEAEADAFIADLKERARQGRYFSSRTYYTVLASQSS